MDEALLSRIINGFREPTATQRSSIAQALQKEESWLFARAGENGAADPPSGDSHPTALASATAGASAEPEANLA